MFHERENDLLNVKSVCHLTKLFTVLRRQLLGGMLGSAILKDGNPLTLHFVMFIPSIMGQGTVEQQGYWMSKAWTCGIIGTYAQVFSLIEVGPVFGMTKQFEFFFYQTIRHYVSDG